ncbi:hypothetical protein FKW77_002249 [Venturia effusa]|uniref:Uncharacterized protein n=1 Tax=Venturia effusa TaxID=50376 RepID=A0A517LMB9_9PEZI|nr:hypothetical protein FKW77_002249 [Venturia effusa]
MPAILRQTPAYKHPPTNQPARKLRKQLPSVYNPPGGSEIIPMAGDLDHHLLNELFEEIERSPPGIEARKLLIETYIAAGLTETAGDNIRELKTLCSDDAQVNEWYAALCKNDASTSNASSSYPSASYNIKSDNTLAKAPNSRIAAAVLPSDPTELVSEKQKLITSYRDFRRKAWTLLRDRNLLASLTAKRNLAARPDSNHRDLELLGDGKITTVLRSRDLSLPSNVSQAKINRPPDSAREAARKMKANPERAFDICMADLEAMIKWLKDTQPRSSVNSDSLREAIAKRVRLMIVALPEPLHVHANMSLMHIEHENRWKTYVNDETMYGDAIPDILRENFYCTEDGYAWDMEELSQAITSNKGVMRNPLSKHMFTPGDIKGILNHPLGQSLAVLGIEQHKLKQGVRPRTLEEMDRMVQVLMEDMAEDAMDSRLAVDEFLAYIATLPEPEQNALDNLRVPAKDSHTGQAFDGTIGEAVRDAKANKLCFHKAGKSLFHILYIFCPWHNTISTPYLVVSPDEFARTSSKVLTTPNIHRNQASGREQSGVIYCLVVLQAPKDHAYRLKTRDFIRQASKHLRNQ